jgi:hypothetical protein
LLASSGCQPQPKPSSSPASSTAVASATTLEAPAPPPKPPPPLEHGSNEYDERLFGAFKECGWHDLGKLDGRWFDVTSPATDVWICAGHIRWTHVALTDLCISKTTVVEGGLDAEAVWHEDWHDPGDASGLYLYLRERADELSVEAADWETPHERFSFFALKRNPSPADRPKMRCPLE